MLVLVFVKHCLSLDEEKVAEDESDEEDHKVT